MKLLTIRQTAKMPTCPLSEHALRLYVKRGQLPHIRAGSRVYLDYDALLDWTAQQMQNSVKQEQAR